MSKCRPSKWVIPAIVGAGLPLLGAYVISSGKVVDDVNKRTVSALSGNDVTKWAALSNDGRDVTLSGTAPSQEALDAAVKTVAGTYGVRTLAQNVTVAPPPPPPEPLAAPTVESLPLTNLATPTFKGTWPEGKAAAFDVKIGDETYSWGKSPELKSDGAGNWTLTPSKPLAEGMVHVVPEVKDAAGAVLAAAAVGMATIDLTPPATPKLVVPATEAKWPYPISGTWSEEPGAKLSASLAGATYDLGATPALTSDGKGNFTFDPRVELKPGSYDIDFKSVDAAGNTTSQLAKAAIVIAEAQPVSEVKAVKPKLGVVAYSAKPATEWPYPITGTWSETAGNTLTATVEGRNYVAGLGAALTSDGKGSFTFAPNAKFAPGNHDVTFTVKNADGVESSYKAVAAIVVPEPATPEPAPEPAPKSPPEPAPVPKAKLGVVAYSAKPATAWPYAITGTWSEAKGNTLIATVEGRNYVAGLGAALTSDGKGNFTFAPNAKFAPGNHDVTFTVKNADGLESSYKAVAAIVVPEPAPPPPPAAPKLELSTDATAVGNTISGKWSEVAGATLSATLNGREYVLGRGAALSSDGKGGFTFAPSAKLAPGTYPVEFMVMDKTGQMAMATSQIVVAEAPKVEPPPAPPAKPGMAAPTVTKQLDLSGAPIIKGTWPSDLAKSFTVSASGKTYTLGTDANLRMRDGNWSLLPSAGLKDGIYDVVAAATDADGVTTKDETVAELEVDGTPPATPTVAAYEGVKSPESITGTFDAKQSKSLKVTLPAINITAELGNPDSALTADGEGNWTMKLSTPLAPGKYDVNAESADAYKRMVVDATAGEMVITAPPAPPATYDCLAVLKRVDAIFPIRFAYDRDDVQHPYDLTLQYYGAVLKDPRCANITVEVAGHADFYGSEEYNQGLSERRAQTIIDMLSKDGIDASRLVKKGYSKGKPLDPAKTDEARMKNRRVEITATSN